MTFSAYGKGIQSKGIQSKGIQSKGIREAFDRHTQKGWQSLDQERLAKKSPGPKSPA